MRAVVLTSSLRRHRFVASRLASRLEVAGVWQETKSFEPMQYAGSPEDAAVIERHFAARDAAEAGWFAEYDHVRAPGAHMASVPPNGCNAPAEIAAMRDLAPDVVLVFGTGLLRQEIVAAFPGRILNIHLGLSPYYRGAGTNFWPLVNGEPEYCGATVHVLDLGVDTGPILTHVRPAMAPDDGPHDIGNRIIVAAADALADAALAGEPGTHAGVPQQGEGRVYRRADFSADAVRRVQANFAEGMIPAYLSARAERDARVPLVTLGAPR